jgi:hypothetical protein
LFFCPLTLALFQIPLVGNKSSQKTWVHQETICCYSDELVLQKQTSRIRRRGRLEIRGNHLPKRGCRRRDSPFLVTQMCQSFVVNMRWRGSSSLDSEECEEPSLVETDENSDIDA